ncbi:MAG: tetratricopeptide repeat protein [Burkholderiaceae bacterium]|nr:tetratricopeptide repeat protein [Burkholderiaceae bacterium]
MTTPPPMPCLRQLRVIAATAVLLMSFGGARANDVTDISDLFHSGKQAEALAKIDALLGEKSDRPDLRFLKGVLLVESRSVDEAVLVFQQLTEEFPELPEPYNNLAALYAARGDFEKARTALDGALRANPGFAIAHENLGDVYAQLARMSYQRALKIDPSNTAIPPRLALLRELTAPLARKSSR